MATAAFADSILDDGVPCTVEDGVPYDQAGLSGGHTREVDTIHVD